MVFRPSDGAFWKWYGGTLVSPDFIYSAGRFIGGSPGIVTGARMFTGDFNGDTRSDVLVFRPSDGAFWKWYGAAPVSPDFTYEAGRFIGGSPGIVTGAQMIPVDFSGDHRDDVLVYR